ncbi:hypothetical protein ACIQ2D_08805 [Lysinibacillus sp. NPDC097287]|uniref:hypothetical protein n=1 Tax=Lysinibacillus sp. NPDC097287 TaxID=3364144 RepID=UPI0037F52DE7
MKAVLNVKGTKLSVLSINYHCDELFYVRTVDENGNEGLFHDEKTAQHVTGVKLIDLKTALEFPDHEARIVEERAKLISHLEEMQKEENNKLLDIAIDAMEGEPDLPFDNHLSIKQKEYKLLQQRIFGIIDAVEEVKAYTEGFYANADDPAVEA